MNYQNNNSNLNIFASQRIPYEKYVIPYFSYTNSRNIPSREFGYNINNNITNRTMQGFHPYMNMPFIQEKKINA